MLYISVNARLPTYEDEGLYLNGNHAAELPEQNLRNWTKKMQSFRNLKLEDRLEVHDVYYIMWIE